MIVTSMQKDYARIITTRFSHKKKRCMMENEEIKNEKHEYHTSSDKKFFFL
jgi:hypothetical protein